MSWEEAQRVLTDRLKTLHAEGKAGRIALVSQLENGSLGTDHGVAAPVFLVSKSLRGGLYGAHPSLTDLDEGDLKFHTDFRRIYATVLEDVLRIESAPILSGTYEKLPMFERRARV